MGAVVQLVLLGTLSHDILCARACPAL
eukprot:SAG25_NODE_7147_length_501_cov_26.278607_1_plen_26_part_01